MKTRVSHSRLNTSPFIHCKFNLKVEYLYFTNLKDDGNSKYKGDKMIIFSYFGLDSGVERKGGKC